MYIGNKDLETPVMQEILEEQRIDDEIRIREEERKQRIQFVIGVANGNIKLYVNWDDPEKEATINAQEQVKYRKLVGIWAAEARISDENFNLKFSSGQWRRMHVHKQKQNKGKAKTLSA